MQEQVLLGTSYYERLVSEYKVRLPNTIKTVSDAKYLTMAHESHISDKINTKTMEMVLDFENFAAEIFDKARRHIKEFKNVDVREALVRFTNDHAATAQLIEVQESVLAKNDTSMLTYLNAKRHFTIARIFLKKLQEIDLTKLDISELKLEREHRENFELGLFIGLEPMFVIGVFAPLNRDDYRLGRAYAKLVDRYSHIVAKLYTEDYLSDTGLLERKYPANTYARFLEYLQAERNGQILL
jgi:hypothetical protein